MLQKIQSKINGLKKQTDHILQELKDMVNSLPDNDKIKRINSRCFIVKSSDLGDNWTPFYHDFKLQYQHICDIINERTPETIIKILKEIIETGKYRDTKQNWTRIFHPKVREYLKGIFYFQTKSFVVYM